MIRKPFILKIFDAANMQRWNDKIRPVELRELDKQAHKMIIAYILGKCEEENKNKDFDWIEIIEGGIFEFLQRLIITDLKPQLFNKIKEDRNTNIKLNEWVYKQVKPLLSPINPDFPEKLKNYFLDPSESVNKRILKAAHAYATNWEFRIIERANPQGYEISEIRRQLQARQKKYSELSGMHRLALYSNLSNFLDLCGELRFQVRWSHLYIVPRTSVLGHMLIVAMLAYLFSLEIKACKKRCVNNYFSGLFHDLPEVLTRDIINPVKRAFKGLSNLIKEYEKLEMRKKIYKLLPEKWHSEMKMFTEDEFESFVTKNGERELISSGEISKNFNEDKYNPKDGEIVRACDHLAAFTEAYLATKNGITSQELYRAKYLLRGQYKDKIISGVNFGEIYADFD